MTTQRKRSKRRSGGRKPRRWSEPTFLIDHCLGRTALANALRAAGATRLVLLTDRFSCETADAVWLSEAGKRQWIVLTKDRQFRKRRLELLAVLDARVRVFVLTGAGLSSAAQVAAFLTALPKIRRVCHQQRALIGHVTPAGTVTLATTADLRRWLGDDT